MRFISLLQHSLLQRFLIYRFLIQRALFRRSIAPRIAKMVRRQFAYGIALACSGLIAPLPASAAALQTASPQHNVAAAAAHPSPRHEIHGHRRAQPPAVPPAADAPAAEQPAKVVLTQGELTVTADNSDLSQILKHVADLSGMTVDGLGSTGRIYGVYGPGNPREVLTSLLTGSGYNFMMLGSASDGAPRKLLLIAKTADTTPPAARPAPAHSSQDQDQEPPGPGAIVNVPPSDPASQTDDDAPARVQRNLQRLEQMRQQQMQQQQQQQDPQ
jgi:hypothetical protein